MTCEGDRNTIRKIEESIRSTYTSNAINSEVKRLIGICRRQGEKTETGSHLQKPNTRKPSQAINRARSDSRGDQGAKAIFCLDGKQVQDQDMTYLVSLLVESTFDTSNSFLAGCIGGESARTLGEAATGDQATLATFCSESGVVLTGLQLTHNSLTHEGLEIILHDFFAGGIGINPLALTIRRLDLAHNNLGEQGASMFGSETGLVIMSNVVHTLIIDDNNIGNNGLLAIANWLPQASSLKTLSVRNNAISDDVAVESLIAAVEAHGSVVVHIEGNRLPKSVVEKVKKAGQSNAFVNYIDGNN